MPTPRPKTRFNETRDLGGEYSLYFDISIIAFGGTPIPVLLPLWAHVDYRSSMIWSCWWAQRVTLVYALEAPKLQGALEHLSTPILRYFQLICRCLTSLRMSCSSQTGPRLEKFLPNLQFLRCCDNKFSRGRSSFRLPTASYSHLSIHSVLLVDRNPHHAELLE